MNIGFDPVAAFVHAYANTQKGFTKILHPHEVLSVEF